MMSASTEKVGRSMRSPPMAAHITSASTRMRSLETDRPPRNAPSKRPSTMSPTPPPPPSKGGTSTSIPMPSGIQARTGYTATFQPSCAAANWAESIRPTTAIPIRRIHLMCTYSRNLETAKADPLNSRQNRETRRESAKDEPSRRHQAPGTSICVCRLGFDCGTNDFADAVGELAHLLDGGFRVGARFNGVMHDHRDVSGARREFTLPHHVPAADDRDRHNRQARLHGEHDAAALELAHVAVAAARAFRKHDQR